MNKIKVPVLMYHEVLSGIEAQKIARQMTREYIISDNIFEKQIGTLVSKGYSSLLLEDVPRIDSDGKYVILTFDDGWHGNYKYVLPILQKYGFKAIFFITTDLIGTDGYMNWREILELKTNGMSVQSHAVTHHPLGDMDADAALWEISESKKIIEDKILEEVTAISFPHGSYDKNVVKMAQLVGYDTMFTSEVEKTYSDSFNVYPTLLGRIAMTNTMGSDRLFKLIQFDGIEFLKKRVLKNSKNYLKKIIGINNYRKLYRKYYNINLPEGNRP